MSLIYWICYDIISIIQCFQCLAFHVVSIWYFFLDLFRIHIRYSVVLLLKPWKVSWSCKMKLMHLSKHLLSLIMIKIFVFSTFGLWFFVRYVPSFSCAVNGTHANALLECSSSSSSWALLSFHYMCGHIVGRDVVPHRTTVLHKYRYTTRSKTV